MRPAAGIAAVALLALNTALSSAIAETTIVIVRHGEKPDLGLGQLSCQGLNRSLALAPALLARYGKPAAIFAPNPAVMKKDKGIAYAYVRPLATIEPLAIRSGLPVDIRWGMTDIEPLAKRLLAAEPGTYVVAWEHHWGETLSRRLLAQLGGNPADVPTWNDEDFDSIYVIRTGDRGSASRSGKFSREKEGLDGLPAACSDAPIQAHP